MKISFLQQTNSLSVPFSKTEEGALDVDAIGDFDQILSAHTEKGMPKETGTLISVVADGDLLADMPQEQGDVVLLGDPDEGGAEIDVVSPDFDAVNASKGVAISDEFAQSKDLNKDPNWRHIGALWSGVSQGQVPYGPADPLETTQHLISFLKNQNALIDREGAHSLPPIKSTIPQSQHMTPAVEPAVQNSLIRGMTAPVFKVLSAEHTLSEDAFTAQLVKADTPAPFVVEAKFGGLRYTDPLPLPHARQIWSIVQDRMVDHKRGHIVVDVAQPDIGKLRVSFDLTKDVPFISVASDRADYLSALRRSVDVLATELKAMGYDSIEFSFSAQSSPDRADEDTSFSAVDAQTGDGEPQESPSKLTALAHGTRQQNTIIVRI